MIRGIFCRECGFKSMGVTSDDGDTCAVCLERVCSVAAEGKFPFHTFNI